MFKKALKKIESDAQQPFGKGPYPQSVGVAQYHSVSQQPFIKGPYPQSVGVAQYHSVARGRDRALTPPRGGGTPHPA
jgi:hypothetical protein